MLLRWVRALKISSEELNSFVHDSVGEVPADQREDLEEPRVVDHRLVGLVVEHRVGLVVEHRVAAVDQAVVDDKA